MTPDRAEAYERLVRTLAEIEAVVSDSEQECIREAAEALLFSNESGCVLPNSRSVEVAIRLRTSGRVTEDQLDGLLECLAGCGPGVPQAAG